MQKIKIEKVRQHGSLSLNVNDSIGTFKCIFVERLESNQLTVKMTRGSCHICIEWALNCICGELGTSACVYIYICKLCLRVNLQVISTSARASKKRCMSITNKQPGSLQMEFTTNLVVVSLSPFCTIRLLILHK